LFYIAIEPDGEFRFVSVSRDFLVATGMNREQILGTLVREVIPPPSRGTVLNHYREAILSGQTARWEEESVYPAGRRYGEVAVTPLYDASGVATHLIGIVHDVTERKRLEESLRESEERLRLAMSSGTIGVWDWDLSSGRLTVSPEVGRIYGVDVTNLQSYEDFAARVHPDDLAAAESEPFEAWLDRVHEEDRRQRACPASTASRQPNASERSPVASACAWQLSRGGVRPPTVPALRRRDLTGIS
jgi:PAS domain S-box-containing protein